MSARRLEKTERDIQKLKKSIPFFAHKWDDPKDIESYIDTLYAYKHITMVERNRGLLYYVHHYSKRELADNGILGHNSIDKVIENVNAAVKWFHDIHQHIARHGPNSLFTLDLNAREYNLFIKHHLYTITEIERLIASKEIYNFDRIGPKTVETFELAVRRQHTNPNKLNLDEIKPMSLEEEIQSLTIDRDKLIKKATVIDEQIERLKHLEQMCKKGDDE